MQSLKYYLPGIMLILGALVIVAFPEVLVAMVAATIIFAGMGALYLGHMIKLSHGLNRDFSGWHNDNYPWRHRRF